MDTTLQRHCAKYIYVIPEGLRELMSDISREVLRSQPEDIYTFIADYLDALMITRENARIATRLVNTITEIAMTTVELLEKTGMNMDEAGTIVDVLQEVFKKHLEIKAAFPQETLNEEVEDANVLTEIFDRTKIPSDVAEEAAIIIQNAYKNFKERKEKEREILKGMIDWRIAARSAIHLYRLTGVSKEESDRAATLIKAAYKGYFTRRIIRKETTDVEPKKAEEEAAEADEFEVIDGDATSSSTSVSSSSSSSRKEKSSESLSEESLASEKSKLVAAKEIVEVIVKRAVQLVETATTKEPLPEYEETITNEDVVLDNFKLQPEEEAITTDAEDEALEQEEILETNDENTDEEAVEENEQPSPEEATDEN